MAQPSLGVAQPSLKVIGGWPSRLYAWPSRLYGDWPSRLYGGVVAHKNVVSAQSLLVLDLIGTWFGLDLEGFGTKGLGIGLDN